jgi:hypothetical protein
MPGSARSPCHGSVEIFPDIILTGSDRLAKFKELEDASKSDLLRACGYLSTKKDDNELLNVVTAFYEDLLEAKGLSLDEGGGKGRSKGDRKLSFTSRVQFNGNLLVGKAYTAILGLEADDEFKIMLRHQQIKLIPLGGDNEEA